MIDEQDNTEVRSAGSFTSGDPVRDMLPEQSDVFGALRLAQNGMVLAFAQASRVNWLGFYPFLLHLRNPDMVPWLPMTSTVAVMPGRTVELASGLLPPFRVADVVETRRVARWDRYNQSRHLPDDFVLNDWENGVNRHRQRLNHLLLPPHAFVSLERVRSDGATVRVPRPTLGRYAERNALRPRILVPGATDVVHNAVVVLAEADLVLVDLQGLRGQRARAAIRSVLQARKPGRPTLAIASSPADVLSLGLETTANAMCTIVGPVAHLETVAVRTTGRDRLAADAQFTASLEGTTDLGEDGLHLARIANYAWWAIRQATAPDTGRFELERFERTLERLSDQDAFGASLFTECHNLLRQSFLDVGLRTQRLDSAVDAVLSAQGAGDVLVLARSSWDVAALTEAVARILDVKPADLAILGVSIATSHAIPPDAAPETVVLVGYEGNRTITAVMQTKAKTAVAVFDPVETRVAWYNATTMANYFDQAGLPEAARPLHHFANGLSRHVIGFSNVEELGADDLSRSSETLERVFSPTRASVDGALVYFLDGTWVDVPLGARFERLGRNGHGSHVVTLAEIAPGDEIVMLDPEARQLFSEKRMSVLDEGPLKVQNQARQAWFLIVQTVAKAKGFSPGIIAHELRQRGHRITEAAVRVWISADPHRARAPQKFSHFKAFANVLQMGVSDDMLAFYFESIRMWRVSHRRAGRQVAQAIRLAYSGRLGAFSLARIERDWGVGIRSLVAAAHVAVVDEVILPNEEEEDEDAHKNT